MTLLHRVILIVLVALLPALGAEIYNQQALRTAQQTELDDDAQREARGVAAELGRILDGTRNAMVALAAMPAVAAQDGPACGRLLQSIRARFFAIRVLALVGSDDRVVCSSAPEATPGGRLSNLAHVRLARARGRFAVAGYLYAHWIHAGVLATALPVISPAETSGVREGQGGRQGGAAAAGGGGPVLIADIGLDWLDRQMRTLAQQADARIGIVDRGGTLLVGVPDGPAPGTPLAGPERALLGAGQLTLAHLHPADGRRYSVAVARLSDLAVLVRLDRSEAATSQRRAAQRSYAMFAAGLVAALACALVLARRTVAAPVARILDTVTRWRAGEAAARVAPAAPASELGRIGAALNDLLAAFEQTEAGLRAQRSELERRVAERTRQLEAEVAEREQTQRQLQQAQRMEVIGRLTGGVAHDFNNLLTAVIGNLELAGRRSRDRPAVTRLLDGAMRAAERGAALTQRMLAFGRQQYLRLQPTDVAALLAGMEELLARSIGPTVALRMLVEPDLWPTRADAGQLEMVLLNLAINARDAMPEGGSLTIDVARERVGGETVRDDGGHPARLAAGDYVRIAVRDSGAGMDPATLARVLEPFFTTKPAGKGSGLGLSMAHGVAAQSGGGLTIDSAVGRGTTVSVWLPRATGAVLQPAAGAPAGAASAAAETARGAPPGLTLLLVDDDEAVAEVTRRALLDAGYAVLHREDGPAALALLDAGAAVDLLIADLAMPGMNGLQLAAAARDRRPALPVLLATGDIGSAALKGGDPGYPVLEKPFRAAQLLQAVAAAIPHRTPALSGSRVSSGR